MKALFGLLALFFLRPSFAIAAGFEAHFGDYAVISAKPINSVPFCPYTDARIERRIVDGYPTIVLEAFGKGVIDTNVTCEIREVWGLSFQGLPGLTCTESENQILCTDGESSYQVTASVSADGQLTLRGLSKGAYQGEALWVLRRK